MVRRVGFRLALGLWGVMLPACTISSLVRTQAAYDFSCPENQVKTVETATVIKATGCGREALYNGSAMSPIARASFDLACPAEQLKMTDLGNMSIGVDGCGKRASYAWVDGAWVGR